MPDLRRRAWLLFAASIALQIALHQSAKRLKSQDAVAVESGLNRRSFEVSRVFIVLQAFS